MSAIGEANVPPESQAAKLLEFAERFKALQATTLPQLGDNPAIASLKLEAQKAIDVGELEKADTLLAKVEAEQRSAIDRLFVNAAETSWPAPGSEDTELGVLMEPEVGHGETEVYAGVQA